MHKIVRSYTLAPTSIKAIEDLSNFTNLDASAIVGGCVEAAWAAVRSQGYRKFPSVITALCLTGPAKSGFYVEGKRQDET